MSRIATAMPKDFARGCLVYILAAAIIIPLACLFIFVPLAIVGNSSSMDETTVLLVMGIPAGLFLAILFGGGAFAIYWTRARRARQWDAIFTPLGLIGSSYLFNFRQYHGTVNGRQVDAFFHRGPTLRLYLDTALQTRLGVIDKDSGSRALAGLMNRQRLTSSHPGLTDLDIYALDQGWAGSLLAQPEVPALLKRLVSGPSDFLIHQVLLQPGAFVLYFYRNKGLFSFEVGPSVAQQWLADLMRLAEIAESLPAPQETAEPSTLEDQVRQGQTRALTIGIIITLVIMLPICMVVPIVVGVLLLAG